MRSQLLPSLLVLGLVASLTPLGVLGVLAVTGTRKSNGMAFIAGWCLALMTFAVLGSTVLHGTVAVETEPSRLLNGLVAVLGIAMVIGAFMLRARSTRPRPASPKGRDLQTRLDGLGARGSLVAGFAMAPYPIGFEAGVLLIQSSAGQSTRLVALIVFCVLSVWPMIAVLLVVYRGGERLQARLGSLHDWIETHRTQMGFWLLLCIGIGIAIPAAQIALGRG